MAGPPQGGQAGKVGDALAAKAAERSEELGSSGPWLNRNVIGMSLASFFSDAGHEAATAILPLFLLAIGAPVSALGFIEGIADATSSFVKLGAGWWSDRMPRRKPIPVLGYLLTGITTGLFGFASGWSHVLIARVLGWLSRGIRGPVRDAMLAASVPPEARGRAFGFHRMGDTLGAILGPIMALGLVSLLTHTETIVLAYRQVFWLSVIPGLLSALCFAFLVTEERRTLNAHRGLFHTVRGLPPRFRLFLIGVGVFGLGDFAHSLLTLRAAQMLAPGRGLAEAGQIAVGLYAVRNVFYAGMSFPLGALADRVGKRNLLAGGYLVAAVMGLGWMVAVPSPWLLAVLFALGGTFIAAEDALEGALAADLLPADIRGTGYGVLATVNGLGDFLSSIVVSVLWASVGPVAGFAYAAVLALLGAVIIYRVR